MLFGQCQILPMQKFGEKLRILRKQRGMTLKELALTLGLSTHSHLSNIETGKRTPSTELIIKIAQFFDVSVDQLLMDDQELD